MKLNENFFNLREDYLFAGVAKRVEQYQGENPGKKLIRLGIGDVTLPLAPAVVAAMQAAVAQMGCKATFRGYGPVQGYAFLREAIAGDYAARGIALEPDDLFISDGAKSDLGNILELFAPDNTVLLPNPVYPAYADANIMAGRRLIYSDANAENGFLPLPNSAVTADIIYLCSPNNPTGAVYSREQLGEWVAYALARGAVILFDAAYEAFVHGEALPRSIYEVEGARQCAIEFCSFSKTAGFTGTRCGYTVVPRELTLRGTTLQELWLRRQSTKFNGVPYMVQRGAEAVYSAAGRRQVRANIESYRENAVIIADALRALGLWFTGGENSPYLWLKCPDGLNSWAFFDRLLNECGVVGTPGSGFGTNGEGYFRLSAFADKAAAEIAVKRMAGLF